MDKRSKMDIRSKMNKWSKMVKNFNRACRVFHSYCDPPCNEPKSNQHVLSISMELDFVPCCRTVSLSFESVMSNEDGFLVQGGS